MEWEKKNGEAEKERCWRTLYPELMDWSTWLSRGSESRLGMSTRKANGLGWTQTLDQPMVSSFRVWVFSPDPPWRTCRSGWSGFTGSEMLRMGLDGIRTHCVAEKPGNHAGERLLEIFRELSLQLLIAISRPVYLVRWLWLRHSPSRRRPMHRASRSRETIRAVDLGRRQS